MGGLTLKPNESIEIVFDTVWTRASSAIDPFDIDVPAEFLAANPNMSFDFSQTYLNSDLDVSRLELGVRLQYRLNPRFALTGSYRYLDYEDDTPYLYDTSGSIELVSLGLGWVF